MFLDSDESGAEPSATTTCNRAGPNKPNNSKLAELSYSSIMPKLPMARDACALRPAVVSPTALAHASNERRDNMKATLIVTLLPSATMSIAQGEPVETSWRNMRMKK